MEIIAINNKHQNIDNSKEYGCVCNTCGTVFTFKQEDVCSVKHISFDNNNSYIKCPNDCCGKATVLSSKHIFEFTNDYSKEDFINQYVNNQNN